MVEGNSLSSARQEDVFEEVFGEDKNEKLARERLAKEKAEKTEKAFKKPKPEKTGEKAIEEEPKKEQIAEKKPKQKKQKIAVKEAEEPLEEDPEKKELKKKIKKVIIAKAERAAEKDEAGIFEKEEDIKEKGIKETSSKEKGAEEESEKGLGRIKPNLNFLKDSEGNVFIGRKGSVYQKYGSEAGLYIGNIIEKDFENSRVFLDGLNPHVVFICGARGSGKSYIIGVIAEELAIKNPNVGIIVVDPVGVFWGMKHSNKDDRELESLAKVGLMPKGLSNLKVFIPQGLKDKVPKSTFDATFSVPPALLTTDDWCLTFGIDRFSPSGLLLEKALHKVKHGYKSRDGKYVKAKENFRLEELIDCLQLDNEINSQELGYKADSIRALSSRFDAAKAWGVFGEKGTPLAELSREKQLTVIDTSFLDDSVSALIIGLLARRILAARKTSTRREAASKFKEDNVESLLEFEVPPTWLFIDEAHTLIPSGNLKTPASTALTEYVKQGRQPGCSLVFATQQPSAIDTRVLSQLDVIVSHKLVFDDDIKAVYKRTPAIIPGNYKASNFIKTLPVGVALVGDRREETTRAFVMRIRPRMSQHEGREAVTSERESPKLEDSKVLALAVGMAFSQIEKEPVEASIVGQIVQKLNAKYESSVQLSSVLDELEKRGVQINPKNSMLSLPTEETDYEIAEEIVEETEKEVQKEANQVLPNEKAVLMAFSVNISEEPARRLFDKTRQKKMLGLFGREESIEKISLKYLPVFHVKFNFFRDEKNFNIAEAYINSRTGEFLQYDFGKKQFIESSGLNFLADLSVAEARALLLLSEKKRAFEELASRLGEDKGKLEKTIDSLMQKELLDLEKTKESEFIFLKIAIDLPKNPMHSLLASLGKLPVSEVEASNIEKPVFDKAQLQNIFQKLWGKTQIKSIGEVFLPVYEAVLRKSDGKIRMMAIEAFSGREIKV